MMSLQDENHLEPVEVSMKQIYLKDTQSQRPETFDFFINDLNVNRHFISSSE